jgi:sugar phosphate permease
MVYSSEIGEIVTQLGESKARVGLGLTAYYITYAIAQVVIAPFVKKINIGLLMVSSLVLSAILYALIPFTTSLYQLWIILGVNGILHASTYGGCMYFFGKYLPPELNAPSCSVMSFGFIGGTVVSYVVAPVFIAKGWWKWTFLLFAAILMISVITFLVVEKRIEKVFKRLDVDNTKAEVKNEILAKTECDTTLNRNVFMMALYTTVAMIFIHITYYVVSSWFPVYLAEIFNMSSSYSVLVSVILYIGAFVCTNACIILSAKSNLKLSSIIRAVCAIALVVSVVQALTYRNNFILAIVLSTLIVSFTRATSTLSVSYLPLKTKNYINAATLSMILNAAACIGAAFGPAAAGTIIDNSGWTAYYFVMCAFFAVSFIAILLCTSKIKKLNI